MENNNNVNSGVIKQKLTSTQVENEPHYDTVEESDESFRIDNNKDESFISDMSINDHGKWRDKWPIHSKKIESWRSVDVLKELLEASESVVCESVPQLCQDNHTFIIDRTKLMDPRDITGDDNGTFERPSGFTSKVSLNSSGHIKFNKSNPNYTVKRLTYRHKGTKTFKRIVYEVINAKGKKLPYVMLQYYFLGGKVETLTYTRHGNSSSRSSDVFMPRTKSLRDRIRALTKDIPPDKVQSSLVTSVGCENVTSISNTPRDLQQVYNMKRTVENAHKSKAGTQKTSDFDSIFRMSMHGDFVKKL